MAAFLFGALVLFPLALIVYALFLPFIAGVIDYYRDHW